MPEPSLEPPADEAYLTTGCGHEVYKGETYVWWKTTAGKTVSLCPDCFRDKIDALSIKELALLLSCDYETAGDGSI